MWPSTGPPRHSRPTAGYNVLSAVHGSLVRLNAFWYAIAPGTPAQPDSRPPTRPIRSTDGATWTRRSAMPPQHHVTPILTLVGRASLGPGPQPARESGLRVRRVGPQPDRVRPIRPGGCRRATAAASPTRCNPGQFLPRVRYFEIWNEENIPLFLAAPNLFNDLSGAASARPTPPSSRSMAATRCCWAASPRLGYSGEARSAQVRGRDDVPAACRHQVRPPQRLHRRAVRHLRRASLQPRRDSDRDHCALGRRRVAPSRSTTTSASATCTRCATCSTPPPGCTRSAAAARRSGSPSGAGPPTLRTARRATRSRTRPGTSPTRCTRCAKQGASVVVWQEIHDGTANGSAGHPGWRPKRRAQAVDAGVRVPVHRLGHRPSRLRLGPRARRHMPSRSPSSARRAAAGARSPAPRPARDGVFTVRFSASGNATYRAQVAHGPRSLAYYSAPIPPGRHPRLRVAAAQLPPRPRPSVPPERPPDPAISAPAGS